MWRDVYSLDRLAHCSRVQPRAGSPLAPCAMAAELTKRASFGETVEVAAEAEAAIQSLPA